MNAGLSLLAALTHLRVLIPTGPVASGSELVNWNTGLLTLGYSVGEGWAQGLLNRCCDISPLQQLSVA